MDCPQPSGRLHVAIAPGALAVFGAGYLSSALSGDYTSKRFLEDRYDSGYTYTNPLLDCDAAEGLMSEEFRPSQRAVQEVIDAHIASGDVTMAGVYFRDLNNGPWFGIDEDTSFAASSMLKVAHMIAVYRHAESDAGLLERTVTYRAQYHTEPQTILPEEQIVPGERYTVGELVERMIIHSDNEALYLLQDQVPEAAAEAVYVDLGMEFTVDNEISVRGYATLFRVLYNASYLNSDFSEKALELLARTRFEDGLRAGVPVHITVAHKFGERALANPHNQLHDCGIVYYPNHPYLVCVMTRGRTLEGITSTVQDVSRTLYEQMRIGFGDG